MKLQEIYKKQVALLLDVLPLINKNKCFALKGGTAINLFVRDFPGLSVDIDLHYLPIETREVFLENLTVALEKLANEIITEKSYAVKNIYTKKKPSADETVSF